MEKGNNTGAAKRPATARKRVTAAAPAAEAPVRAATKAATALVTERHDTADNATDKAAEFFLRHVDDLAAIQKDGLEAVVAANAVYAKHLEAMSREIMGLTQASLEAATKAATAMFGARTLTDVVAVNRDFAKDSYERLVERTARMSELAVGAANEAMDPIRTKVGASFERYTRQVA